LSLLPGEVLILAFLAFLRATNRLGGDIKGLDIAASILLACGVPEEVLTFIWEFGSYAFCFFVMIGRS
jgi:hypothetical protein